MSKAKKFAGDADLIVPDELTAGGWRAWATGDQGKEFTARLLAYAEAHDVAALESCAPSGNAMAREESVAARARANAFREVIAFVLSAKTPLVFPPRSISEAP